MAEEHGIDEAKFTGISKYFNGVTNTGRANVSPSKMFLLNKINYQEQN